MDNIVEQATAKGLRYLGTIRPDTKNGLVYFPRRIYRDDFPIYIFETDMPHQQSKWLALSPDQKFQGWHVRTHDWPASLRLRFDGDIWGWHIIKLNLDWIQPALFQGRAKEWFRNVPTK